METLFVTNKLCRRCFESRSVSEFSRQAKSPDGLQFFCKPCFLEIRKKWKVANPAKQKRIDRRSDLKKKFGITVNEYDTMLKRQGGVCAICRKKCKSSRVLAVDHNHATGAIRGLLCGNCNRGLGCYQDDKDLMRAAIAYLDEDRGGEPLPS